MFYRSILHYRQFRYLGAFYLHYVIRTFAVSIFTIFNSIYIYQILLSSGLTKPQSLGLTALFFCLVYLLQALLTIPSVWLISKKGLIFTVFWSNFLLVAYFISLYLSQFDPIFLILAALLYGLHTGLYWTAFHIYLVELSDDKNQGEEIAWAVSLSTIASVGGPAFGGLLINYTGFGVVFLIMSVLTVIAVIPLRYLPKQKDSISVSVTKMIQVLSPKKEAKAYLALIGMGTVDNTTTLFWPIFVFPILSAGFVGLGFLESVVSLLSTVTTTLTGYLTDKLGPHKIIGTLSSLDSMTWTLRTLVITPLQTFVLSSLGALSWAGESVSFDTLVYERARHEDLVALVVQRELGLSTGKVMTLFLLGLLLWFDVPLMGVFIFTAVFTLLTRLYPNHINSYQTNPVVLESTQNGTGN